MRDLSLFCNSRFWYRNWEMEVLTINEWKEKCSLFYKSEFESTIVYLRLLQGRRYFLSPRKWDEFLTILFAFFIFNFNSNLKISSLMSAFSLMNFSSYHRTMLCAFPNLIIVAYSYSWKVQTNQKSICSVYCFQI